MKTRNEQSAGANLMQDKCPRVHISVILCLNIYLVLICKVLVYLLSDCTMDIEPLCDFNIHTFCHSNISISFDSYSSQVISAGSGGLSSRDMLII